jgi:hypothetical protein
MENHIADDSLWDDEQGLRPPYDDYEPEYEPDDINPWEE